MMQCVLLVLRICLKVCRDPFSDHINEWKYGQAENGDNPLFYVCCVFLFAILFHVHVFDNSMNKRRCKDGDKSRPGAT